MARRSVLLLVALVIALVGTGLIIMYVQGIESRATKDQELVEVLTVTEEIAAGETVAAAQEAGKFEQTTVRRTDMVEGALNSTGSISDLVAVTTLYPGEQLIAKKFGSIGQQGNLLIPDDKMAISFELTDFERVAGFVNPGNEVAIFGSRTGEPKEFTKMVLPRVMVVGVGHTSSTSRTTTTEEGEQTIEEVPKTILTIAVTQEEAEKVIFADRFGDLNFALLTDETKSSVNPGVDLLDVLPDIMRRPVTAPWENQ